MIVTRSNISKNKAALMSTLKNVSANLTNCGLLMCPLFIPFFLSQASIVFATGVFLHDKDNDKQLGSNSRL